MTKEAGDIMTPGTHGTTYGGNPLAMAIANAVFDELSTPSFLENVTKWVFYSRTSWNLCKKNSLK